MDHAASGVALTVDMGESGGETGLDSLAFLWWTGNDVLLLEQLSNALTGVSCDISGTASVHWQSKFFKMLDCCC